MERMWIDTYSKLILRCAQASAQSSESCLARVASCEENTGSNKKIVCGNDGRNYPSRCDLMKAQCSAKPVGLAHRGPCAGKLVI